jgi:hypothetical protein
VIPFRGERARGLTPSAGVSEASSRAELMMECGSTPTARSKKCEAQMFSWLFCKGSMRSTYNGSRSTKNAHVAQLVEHVLGKDEVTRSIRVVGSIQSSLDPERSKMGATG